MQIRFKRISDTRHILSIVRPDGTEDRVECETKSALRHDLVHYAVEVEAGLDGGFWGLLARGYSLSDLNDRTGQSIRNDSGEIMTIEAVVGAMQGFLASDNNRTRAFVDALRDQGEAFPLPEWCTEEFVERVGERVRRLVGHWNSVPFGDEMALEWPPVGPAGTPHTGLHRHT